MNHIVYDYQIFIAQKYGGISRYIYEISRKVVKEPDIEATILAPLHINSYIDSGPVPVRGFRMGNRLPKIGRAYSAVNMLVSASYLKFHRPFLLHETYYSSHSVAPKGRPIVITVYDMIHEKFAAMLPAGDRTSDLKRKAVKRADRVICISRHTQQDLIQLFDVPEEKTIVIPLGFGLEIAAGKMIPSASPPSSPYLLYVGNRDSYKNFGGMLKAYAASKRLLDNFLIVAFGGPPISAEELQQIRKLGIPDHRVLHAAGDDAALAKYYRYAAAFVYPSLYEGFGIPPLEAMSLDCPVACSNTSSIPEVVGDSALLFDPADTESMSNAIERVATDSAVRRELIARGRKRIELFSWDRCASMTANLYREMTQS
jgi:glycosyltransferase involved in cell wall biosynthesis